MTNVQGPASRGGPPRPWYAVPVTSAGAPSCPRCGYDLTGVVESWKDWCPLEGTCSECGHVFPWSDALLPERLILNGFFEHARGFWQRLRWAWRTWWWTLWPPRFWRRVGVTYPPRARAIVLWPAFSVLVLWAIIPILDNVSFLIYLTNGLRRWGTIHRAWRFFVVPWTVGLASRDRNSGTLSWSLTDVSPIYGPGLALGLTIPLVVLCLSRTCAAAKISRASLLRAVVFSLAWLTIPPILALPRTLEFAVSFIRVGFLGDAGPDTFPSDFGSFAGWWTYHYWHAVLALIAAWIIFWWATAISTLFAGHHPRRVLAIALIPGLLAFIASLLLSRDFQRVMFPQ